MKKERFLELLLDLINSLSRSEMELARKHLKAYASNYTANRNKMFRLFDLIGNKGLTDFDAIKKKTAPKITENSFNRLIKRTMDKIQESLILDINIKRKDVFSETFQVRFEVRKQLIKGQILRSKGLIVLAKKVINSVIKRTKIYELYDELIEALFYLQGISSSSLSMKEFAIAKEEIEFFENCRKRLQEAKSMHQDYQINAYSKASNTENYKLLEEYTSILNQSSKETNSANIFSYYYLLRMEKHYISGEIDEEIQIGLKFLKLLKSNKAIYSKQRIAAIYSNLSNTVFSACNFKLNYLFSKQSIFWSKSNPGVNTIIAYQNQIRSLFFIGSYIDCLNHIYALEKLPVLKKHSFYLSQVSYFKANTFFALGEFQSADNELYNLGEIEKDKEGWNLWIRIMRILCSIELMRHNLIDYDVESFRKYLQRTSKQYEVRKRNKLILSVLIELDRSNYDFNITANKKEKELSLLASTAEEYKWEPKSPENILFHDWFKAKLDKKVYHPNFEPYQKKIKSAIVKEELNSSAMELEEGILL